MRLRIIRIAIVLFVAGDLGLLALVTFAPVREAAMSAIGRGAGTAARVREDHLRSTEQLSFETRKIKEEQRFHLWEYRGERYWMPNGGEYSLAHLLAEQRERIYGAGPDGVRAGDIVLDCGAHVGVYTRQALKDGAKLVVSIEPSPGNVECLRRNFAAEIAAGRVKIVPKGVWHEEGSLKLWVEPGNSARESFVKPYSAAAKPIVAPLTTIDLLVAELGLERVDFIKMDIEGAERNALAGAQRTLSTYRPRLALASYHLKDDPTVIPSAVSKAWSGYRMKCGQCATDSAGEHPSVLLFQ